MSGALFVVSLPTACYENGNRPVVADSVTRDNVVSENSKNQSSVRENDLLRSKSTVDTGVEESKKKINHDIYGVTKTDKMDSIGLPSQITLSNNLTSNYSASSPAIQNVDRHVVVDMEENNTINSIPPRSVSASNSTEVLISDFPGNTNKSNKESEKSIVNIGKKLVTALTSAKGATTPDAVSTASKPDTAISLETLLLQVLEKVGVDNAVWSNEKNGNFYKVFFTVESGDQCDECIEYLNECGFGVRPNTRVSVIPCTLFYKGEEEEEVKDLLETKSADDLEEGQKVPVGCVPENDSQKVWDWTKFVSSVRARLTVAQIVESVRANAELTFDFIMLLLVAGMVAAMGLLENSSVVLVASMLISPLMGPILAATFGIVIQDRQLQKIGLFNELLGLASCILVGFIFGVVVGCSSDNYSYADASEWPTNEMISRGVIRSLWVGVLIALPSGAGVALSVLGGNTSSLVGVAISASLLPPAVNAGLLWALAVIKALTSPAEKPIERIIVYSDNEGVEYAMLGAVSLCLTLINIACIFIAAVLVLKVKEVAPQSNRDEMKRFWKHDIKIARDYNRTFHGDDASKLGKQLLEDLSIISQEMEETNHGIRRFNLKRHISESGVPGGHKEGADSWGLSNNQRTWTSGTMTRFQRHSYLPEFRRQSISACSDEEFENLVYSTLNAGSKLGLLRNATRTGAFARQPLFRKISAMSLPGNSQIRSPNRSAPMETHLDTIKESSTSLFPVSDSLSDSQNTVPKRKFQVTRAEDIPVGSKIPSKPPLAKIE